MSGTLPKIPERRGGSARTYNRPKYPSSSSTIQRLENKSPSGLFINEFVDNYEDVIPDDYITTSSHSRSKDLQPRIILQSPLLTSTPRDSTAQRGGRAQLYPPSDTSNSGGHFDPLRDTFLPPQRYIINSAQGEGRKKHTKETTTLPSLEKSYISRIQSRPLPSPSLTLEQKDEHIYLSPIKNKTRESQRQVDDKRDRDIHVPAHLHIPPPKRSPPKPHSIQGDTKPQETRSTGLGKRAVTELDFTRAYASGTLIKRELGSRNNNKQYGQQTTAQEDSLVRKGLLWVQQDKLFSRWKERFIILTTGYIQIFKKGTSRISDMGSFVSKVRLSQVGNITLEDRRGYLTLTLTTQRDGKILLRKPEGIRDWYSSIVHHSLLEKQTTQLKTTDQLWRSRQATDPQNIQDWLLSRDRVSSVCRSPDLALVRKLSPQKQRRPERFKLSYDNSATSYFLPSAKREMFGREDSGFESLATTSIESAAASFKQN